MHISHLLGDLENPEKQMQMEPGTVQQEHRPQMPIHDPNKLAFEKYMSLGTAQGESRSIGLGWSPTNQYF